MPEGTPQVAVRSPSSSSGPEKCAICVVSVPQSAVRSTLGWRGRDGVVVTSVVDTTDMMRCYYDQGVVSEISAEAHPVGIGGPLIPEVVASETVEKMRVVGTSMRATIRRQDSVIQELRDSQARLEL